MAICALFGGIILQERMGKEELISLTLSLVGTIFILEPDFSFLYKNEFNF